MEHYKKKNRIYLTPKSYLRKVRTSCLFIAVLGSLIGATLMFILGVTFTSLGILAGLGFLSLVLIRFIWKNSRSVSLKGDNLILKSMGNQNTIAPVGSIRKVETKVLMGVEYTKIRFYLDGSFSGFFIFTKRGGETPETLIRKQIRASRKRKKEANRKPDSVLTQTA